MYQLKNGYENVVHTMEFYPAIKKNKIIKYAGKWELGNSGLEREPLHSLLYVDKL